MFFKKFFTHLRTSFPPFPPQQNKNASNETELPSSFVSGKAIKHVRDSLFTAESGTRRGIPKVIVVITDGRSQDDVNKISGEMQSNGKFYTDKW